MKVTRLFGLPLLILLLGLLSSFVYINSEIRYYLQQARLDIYEATLSRVVRLESLINANLVVARGVRAEVLLHSGLDAKELDRIAEQLLIKELQIRHIALAPDLVVSYVYPREGNESAIGLDYRDNPEQRDAVMQALKTKKILLAGPLNLVQGGEPALIARVPVYLDDKQDKPWGVIAVVIKFDELIHDAGIDSLAETHQVAIRRMPVENFPGHPVYGDQSVFDKDAIVMEIPLPSGSWEVAIMPSQGWQVPQFLIIRLSLLGLVLSALVAWVVYLQLRSREISRQHLTDLNQQANHDYLTGLPNRLQLTRYLKRITHHEDREQEPFCVVFIDLDNFKDINDSLGHNLGDELLVRVAGRLEGVLRPADFLARLGGDEFVVVLTGMCDPAQCELWANKLILDLSRFFRIGHHDLSVTASVGLAFFPQDGVDATTLLQHADRAMYAAKETGKNTFHFFNLSMRLQADKHVQMYHDMIAALERNQFDVFYQPIMELSSGQYPRCEALLRWQHPDKGWISPMEFIPIAEKTGFIRQLGIWVLHRVCRDMVKLKALGIEVNVAVNRSTNEFRDDATVRQWLPIVRSYNLVPENFTLEITESLLMTEDNHHLDKVRLVKSSGFKLAIDDFGTGYSGINYLRQYPVDIVKIDKSFVANLMDSEQDRTLFQVLVKMAKALDLELVVEGVEYQEQLSLITEKLCEYGQGFFMARPMPFNSYVDFLQSQAAQLAVDKSSSC